MALHNLPLASITPSVNNPRKHFDQTAQDELAASVKKFGVMQPIIVRPDGDGYELVCGERRYRAALQAGLEEIPAIVRELSDDEAFDLQITENLQRKDINPMEESDAFHALTKRGKTSAAQIAKRFGKSEKYVYDRLALQRCILSVQDQVRSGDLPLKHAKQFAQLNMDDQQALYDACIKRGTVDTSDIKDIISRQFSYVLDEAPFNIKNPNLLPSAGACTKCPKRSGCNQLLFEDVDSKDICFDKTCYDKKVEAHIEHRIKELQDAGMTVHRISKRMSTQLEGVLDYMQWTEIEKDEDGYEECTTVGVLVEVNGYTGEEYKVGDVIKIEVDIQDEDADEDADEDENDEPISQIGTTSANSNKSGLSRYDHARNLRQRIREAAFKAVEQNLSTEANEACLRRLIVEEIDRLDFDLFEEVAEKLGWQVVKDEDGDTDTLATAKQVVNSAQNIGQLAAVAFLINSAEQVWDRDDADTYNDTYKAAGIDIHAIMDAYEQETGHNFN